MGYQGSIHSRFRKTIGGHLLGHNDNSVKIYVFDSALSKNPSVKKDVDLLQVLQHVYQQFWYCDIFNGNEEKFQYHIAMAWGENDGKPRCASIVSFSEGSIDDNNESEVFIFKDGIYQPNDKSLCEVGYMIVGREVELRKKTKYLDNYMKQWPDISDLQRRTEIIRA